MSIAETFEMYDKLIYTALKWSVTVPSTMAGTILDLCLLGLPKLCIDMTPLMTTFPFFRDITRSKEREWFAESSFFNKGFAGIFRAAASILLEIPLSIAAPVIAFVMTTLHTILAQTIGYPFAALASCVATNMCG